MKIVALRDNSEWKKDEIIKCEIIDGKIRLFHKTKRGCAYLEWFLEDFDRLWGVWFAEVKELESFLDVLIRKFHYSVSVEDVFRVAQILRDKTIDVIESAPMPKTLSPELLAYKDSLIQRFKKM